jgi:DNA-directed RNA polymerase specialized sigma24 family protein
MYTVTVQDADGKEITLEVTKAIFLIVDDERRELERNKKEKYRHLSNAELKEDLLPRRSIQFAETPEDQVCLLESLREELRKCSPIQRKRFALFLQGYNLSEIAQIQGCAKQCVQRSLTYVLKRIKKTF